MINSVLYVFINILPYFAIIGVLLAGVKFYLFTKQKTSSWKSQDFLFFDYSHVETSNSENSKKNKSIQNLFSILIISFLILSAVGFLLKNKLGI